MNYFNDLIIRSANNCQEFEFLRVSLSSLDLTVTIFQGKGSYSEFPLSLQFLIDNFMTLLNLRNQKNFYHGLFHPVFFSSLTIVFICKYCINEI